MNENERRQEVANEVALEAQYQQGVIEKERRFRGNLRAATQNQFTADLPTAPIPAPQLVGRVKLGAHSEIVDAQDFYIGSERFNGGDEFQVYPWSASIACAFYRKPKSHHEVCEEVVGIRAFTHRIDMINDLQDEWLDNVPHSEQMFAPRELRVPLAPRRPRVPSASPTNASPPAAASPSSTTTAPIAPPASETRPSVEAPAHRETPAPPNPRESSLRTVELLRRQLASPKEAAMSAALATLQPDQYRAITALATDNQILQGHPGTGKTIIAVHRAAYLVSLEDDDDTEPDDARARGTVLLVGPTAEYVAHVSRALRALNPTGTRVRVVALPSLLDELAGLASTSAPTATSSYQDVDLELAELVDKAFRRVMKASESRPTAEAVYASLKGFPTDPPDGVLDREWARYLRELPDTYDEIRRDRRRAHRGLMAYIGVRTMEVVPRFGHIIVDEGQDIHPIEWKTLVRLHNDGGWTILGDLNQRRTDHTFSSWDRTADALAIDDEYGKFPVEVLEHGYRSTAQIIAFANQLLPKSERTLYSLQQAGEAPEVHKVSGAASLAPRALVAAGDLHDRVAPGTVAIIAADYDPMRAHMAREGWQASATDKSEWQNGERKIRLLPPERARGLEFDAVVVVEPASFPTLFGRDGVLFTALTRANRLLTVVHDRALPKELRSRGR